MANDRGRRLHACAQRCTRRAGPQGRRRCASARWHRLALRFGLRLLEIRQHTEPPHYEKVGPVGTHGTLGASIIGGMHRVWRASPSGITGCLSAQIFPQRQVNRLSRFLARVTTLTCVAKATLGRHDDFFPSKGLCLGQGDQVSPRSAPDQPLSALTARRTSSAWPGTLTFNQLLAMRPVLPIRKVERSTPMYFFPYMDFSTQTP